MKRFLIDDTKNEKIQREIISSIKDPKLVRQMNLVKYETVFPLTLFILFFVLVSSVYFNGGEKNEMVLGFCFLFVLPLIVIVIIKYNALIHDIKIKLKEINKDLAYEFEEIRKQRLELDDDGLSFIYYYLRGKGRSAGSGGEYYRKRINKKDIQEIVSCSELSVMILIGAVSTESADDGKDYRKGLWHHWGNSGNLRVYDQWINPESPSDDLFREISETFGVNIRYIDSEEVMKLIKNDRFYSE